MSSGRFWSAAIFGDKKIFKCRFLEWPVWKKGSFESDLCGTIISTVACTSSLPVTSVMLHTSKTFLRHTVRCRTVTYSYEGNERRYCSSEKSRNMRPKKAFFGVRWYVFMRTLRWRERPIFANQNRSKQVWKWHQKIGLLRPVYFLLQD
jgi:hypothetical protein